MESVGAADRGLARRSCAPAGRRGGFGLGRGRSTSTRPASLCLPAQRCLPPAMRLSCRTRAWRLFEHLPRTDVRCASRRVAKCRCRLARAALSFKPRVVSHWHKTETAGGLGWLGTMLSRVLLRILESPCVSFKSSVFLGGHSSCTRDSPREPRRLHCSRGWFGGCDSPAKSPSFDTSGLRPSPCLSDTVADEELMSSRSPSAACSSLEPSEEIWTAKSPAQPLECSLRSPACCRRSHVKIFNGQTSPKRDNIQ